MSEWRSVSISEMALGGGRGVAGGPFGSELGRKDYVSAGVPVIRGAQVVDGRPFTLSDIVFVTPDKADRHRGNLAFPGDVIVTQRGTVGQVGLIPVGTGFDRFLLSQSQMKISVDPDLAVPEFVYFSLRSDETRKRLIDLTMSAGVPHINLATLREFRIDLPSLETQRRVAAVLLRFNEMIEINERRIELLEDLARSLYREWFVRFRFPGHEQVDLVESELGPIPCGWRVSRVGDVVDLRYGKSLPARNRRRGEVAVVSSAGVIDEHDEALVRGPGVVVGRKGNVGSIWWVDRDFFPIDTTYYVVSAQPLGLLYWQFLDMEFIDSHAAVPGLSRDQAYALRILVPDPVVSERFADINAELFDSISVCRDRARGLGATRDLLLPRLVTGRLDISEIDLGELLPAEVA